MKFTWVTINVTDMKASLAFYTDILGLTVNRQMNPMPGTEIAFLGYGNGGTEVELIHNAKNTSPSYGNDISIGFSVDSLDEFMAFLSSKFFPVHSGPFQPNPIIKFIYLTDPNGLKVQIIEHAVE